MKVWMKKQNVVQAGQQEVIIGICDEKLIGKTIGQFSVSEHFFKGELVDINSALNSLKDATICNIVGKNIVNAALKKGIIEKEGIKKFKNIPHAQIITM